MLSQSRTQTMKKVTEFRLYPTDEQMTIIDLWLTQLKWVWNTGICALEESQQRTFRVKAEWTEYSPEVWQWRKSCTIDGQKYTNPDNQFGLTCPYYPDKVDIRQHQHIEDAYKSVKNYHFIANIRCPEFLHSIDSEARRSVVDSLIDSWSQYQKGKKGRPRYKKRSDKLDSFANGNGRTKVSFTPIGDNDNAYMDYPKLGKIKVKGFYRRYIGNHTIVRIVKKADGYFVQITSDFDEKPIKAAKKPEIGLDFGCVAPIADSDGRMHMAKKYAKTQAKKLARIQRSISRSQDGSNRLKAKRKRLAKVHGKIARQRDRLIHKLTSKYVSEYQAIAIEDTQVRNMVRAPKAKLGDNGAYLPNGASAKAGLNKSILESAIGKTKTMLESKSKASQRVFKKVPARYTSQGCSSCGHYHESFRPNQSSFGCLHCGHSENADTNASKTIRNIAFKGLELIPYPASSGEFTDVDYPTGRTKRQPKSTKKDKGSRAERTLAITPFPEPSEGASTETQSSKDFELWQSLKTPIPDEPKANKRKPSAQSASTIGSQLSFWDLADAMMTKDDS